ncbi:MAG: ribonuclease III [Oscillospiraceae bacterium]|nr:ribonuclease III [Oscillospiraceae bacterium]
MNFQELQKKLNYSFKNKEFLKEALSHSSYSNEPKRGYASNERLEFLGDSILSFIISEYLFTNFKYLPEGELTKTRASIVCERALYEFAEQINLKRYIKLGKGEEVNGGRERPSIISDAFEAIIAAIYLDGGMEEARKYVLGFVSKKSVKQGSNVLRDYKTTLQEITQRNPEEQIEYFHNPPIGPDHDRVFIAEVLLNGISIGRGEGHSKKQAEQMAAKEALALMGKS